MDNDYMTSLCIQWSLEFTKNDIINYICNAEDLPIEIRNKIRKMYTKNIHEYNNRVSKDKDYAIQINHIYVVSKIINRYIDTPYILDIIKTYAYEMELDMNSFNDIIKELEISSFELVNKYWE